MQAHGSGAGKRAGGESAGKQSRAGVRVCMQAAPVEGCTAASEAPKMGGVIPAAARGFLAGGPVTACTGW